MKRIIDYYLLQWKHSSIRKPLLLRGARQVGKTYAARELGKTYESFVEINLESDLKAHEAFTGDLDPQEMILKLHAATKKLITPGKTLLFIDEIQTVPRAIIALRYFYEILPELHVIAAGSLLDFAIQKVGVPVGRIQSLEMHPVSFIEYLGYNNQVPAEIILNHEPTQGIKEPTHSIGLENLLGRYLAIGGMPQAIAHWINTQNPLDIARMHASILNFYRQDFSKYAEKHEIKYVETIFRHIPLQLGHKFKYSAIEGDYRKRELAPALDLLITAGIAHKVYYSAGQGIPLGAQSDDLDYKVIFLDVGLTQTSLGLDITEWFLQPQQEFIKKGALMEAFVGQEIVAYANPHTNHDLYYWHKDSSPAQAEIDYLINIDRKVIPVEVKSGDGRTLKSLHRFLESHEQSPYGIKFSTQDYSVYNNIHSYPLYAVAKVMSDFNSDMKNAILCLISEPKVINFQANFGNQSTQIEKTLFDTPPLEEQVIIINFIDDKFKPSLNRTINDLNDLFSNKNQMIMNRLHDHHKKLRVIQLMHENVIVWQTAILDHLLKFNL